MIELFKNVKDLEKKIKDLEFALEVERKENQNLRETVDILGEELNHLEKRLSSFTESYYKTRSEESGHDY